jgi:hypothetical protein
MPAALRSIERETPPAADEWIDLDDPGNVFEGIVPNTLRIDEQRIGRRPFDEVTACLVGSDDRRALVHMLARPNRWLCKLQVAFRNPDTGRIEVGFGSGLLVGERHVLTAAHVLTEEIEDQHGKFKQSVDALAVVVIPGLDGRGRRAAGGRSTDTMPFGWTHGTAFRMARVFRLANRASGARPRDFDYAVVRLAAAIGARRFRVVGDQPLGWWGYPAHRGRTRILVKSPSSLRRVKVNSVGYPGDKCRDRPAGRSITRAEYDACPVADLGSVPWYSFDRIVSGGTVGRTFDVLELSSDLAPGMSGGPVWLRWKSIRNLIGILHACDPFSTEANPFVGGIATKITDEVRRDIEAWTS